MRISTSSFYQATLGGIQNYQSKIATLSQKIAEGKDTLTPREDALGTSRGLDLANSVAVRKQYQANQDKAELAMELESTYLDSLYESLSDMRNTIYAAGSGQDQNTRDQVALQISNLYSMVKDIGNARDSQGNFIFAGHESDSAPFAHAATYPSALPGVPPFTSNPTLYSGDSGVREVTIDNGRDLRINDDLQDLFMGDGTDAQDLLQTLDYAASALHDAGAAASSVDSALTTAVTNLDRALEVLESLQTGLSGRMLELSDSRTINDANLLMDNNRLTDMTQLDQAAAIIELKQLQTNLEASQQTFAMVSGLTLFDYIG
jgi:flagellar hook-associated protein 3 FlgL